jgi:hypothetical protein
MSAMAVAVLLFCGFGAIGTFDVLYYHLYKFRLYQRPESFKEHLLHTAMILLTPLVVAGLYVGRTGGPALWLATVIAGGQVIVLLADVFQEHESRAQLGGVPRLEYLIHIVVCMMHAASLALILNERPAVAWSLNAPMLLERVTLDGWRWAIVILAAVAVPLGVLHVALALRGHRFIRAAGERLPIQSAATAAEGLPRRLLG